MVYTVCLAIYIAYLGGMLPRYLLYLTSHTFYLSKHVDISSRRVVCLSRLSVVVWTIFSCLDCLII